jgi:hypothetical protein
MEKALKARIGTQRIKCRFSDKPKGHPLRMLLKGLFKPCEGLVSVAQPSEEKR